MWLIYENIYGNVFQFKRSLHSVQSKSISPNPIFVNSYDYMIVTNKSLFSPKNSSFVFSFLFSRGHVRLALKNKS